MPPEVTLDSFFLQQQIYITIRIRSLGPNPGSH